MIKGIQKKCDLETYRLILMDKVILRILGVMKTYKSLSLKICHIHTKHSLLDGKLTQHDGNVAIIGKLVRYNKKGYREKFSKANSLRTRSGVVCRKFGHPVQTSEIYLSRYNFILNGKIMLQKL